MPALLRIICQCGDDCHCRFCQQIMLLCPDVRKWYSSFIIDANLNSYKCSALR